MGNTHSMHGFPLPINNHKPAISKEIRPAGRLVVNVADIMCFLQ